MAEEKAAQEALHVWVPAPLARRLEEYLERRYRRLGLVPPRRSEIVKAALERFLDEQEEV